MVSMITIAIMAIGPNPVNETGIIKVTKSD